MVRGIARSGAEADRQSIRSRTARLLHPLHIDHETRRVRNRAARLPAGTPFPSDRTKAGRVAARLRERISTHTRTRWYRSRDSVFHYPANRRLLVDMGVDGVHRSIRG